MLRLQKQHGFSLKAASQVVGLSVSDFERLEPIITRCGGELSSLDRALKGGIKNILKSATRPLQSDGSCPSDGDDEPLSKPLAELYPGPENRNLRRCQRRKGTLPVERLPDRRTPEAELIRREEMADQSDLPPIGDADGLDESRPLKSPALMAALDYWRKQNAHDRAFRRAPAKASENLGPSAQEEEMVEDKRCHCRVLPLPHFHCERCGEVFTSGGILDFEGTTRSIRVFEQPASAELPNDPYFQPAFDESVQTDEIVVRRSPLRVIALCPQCKPPIPGRSTRATNGTPGQ